MSKTQNDIIFKNFLSKDMPSGHVVSTLPKKKNIKPPNCKSKVAAKEKLYLNK